MTRVGHAADFIRWGQRGNGNIKSRNAVMLANADTEREKGRKAEKGRETEGNQMIQNRGGGPPQTEIPTLFIQKCSSSVSSF